MIDAEKDLKYSTGGKDYRISLPILLEKCYKHKKLISKLVLAISYLLDSEFNSLKSTRAEVNV